MSYLTQKTIKNETSFSGISLHSGLVVNLSIKPANPDFGIVFKRVDLKINNLVYPNFANVTNTSLTQQSKMNSELSFNNRTFDGGSFCLGVDNALIEIDNEEVPILDGSAKEFIEKIISTGFKESNSPIKIIKINRVVGYSEGENQYQ